GEQMLGEVATAGGRVVEGIELLIALAVVAAGGAVAEIAVGVVFGFEIFVDFFQALEIVGVAGFLDDKRLLAFAELFARLALLSGRAFAIDGSALLLAQLQDRIIL